MSTDEQQIRELVATWMAATKAGDVPKVMSLMTDDVVFLVAGLALRQRTICCGSKAAETRRAGHTLSVLRKTAGRWQIARDAKLLTQVLN
jgi:ketosteroid isomerase-like protein